MGLGPFTYPRYAVHAPTGRAVPISRMQAGCLWYPQLGIDGQVATGHVLYVARPLAKPLERLLQDRDDSTSGVEVLGGDPNFAHRLARPVEATEYATVERLIDGIIERVRQLLPMSKRKQLSSVSAAAPAQRLVELESFLHRNNVHVLVPLTVGSRYELFTDATEALLPVSPVELQLRQQRGPRLSFVILATDTLQENRDSPWLLRATELLVLPARPGEDPGVMDFVGDVPALQLALEDPHLIGDLALAMLEATGGFPDLCDRFYERLLRLKDVAELRSLLRELTRLSLMAGRDRVRGDEVLALALGARPGEGRAGAPDGLPDLPELREGSDAAQAVSTVLLEPPAFSMADHLRGYLDGSLSWERGLALPRSILLTRVLRGRLQEQAPSQRTPTSASLGAWPPGDDRRRVRWLHVSDFHFRERTAADSSPVLEALLTTVGELARAGRTVDLIFVTGDIAFSGGAGEYALAERYLADLCLAAGVPRKAVHLCPGNHDVNRDAGLGLMRTLESADAALQFFLARTRPHLAKLENFRAFYNRFYGGERVAADGQATALAERVQVRDVSLGILPLNTAWFAQDDSDSGRLLVGEASVRAGLLALEGAALRVALMHHPVADLSHLEQRLVQDRLAERINFLLRGHLHEPVTLWLQSPYRQMMEMAVGAAYQGRVQYQNRAMLVEVEVQSDGRSAMVRPYPLRYELTGHDRFTLDTSVFPRSYPTYLEERPLQLG